MRVESVKKRYVMASLLLAGAVVGILGLDTRSVSAASATFTVTNTNDSGAGSFRQALIDANSNSNPSDMDVIDFNISGSTVHTITPGSPYPEITEKVTINGFSQPGASANTTPAPQPINAVVLIEFDGVNSATGNLSLNVSADGTIIQGINMHACRSFDSNGYGSCIRIAANNVSVQGNYLGTMPDGQTAIANSSQESLVTGVEVASGTGTVIGGTSPEYRNVIANNSYGSQAVSLKSSGTAVEGNYIGIAKDGVTDLGSVGGIGMEGPGNSVGGPLVSQRNLVSGANQANFAIMSDRNVVQGNYICTDYTGSVNNNISTSTGVGINLGSQENLIGGAGVGEGNIIHGCDNGGVVINRITIPAVPLDATPQNNAILGNSIATVRGSSLADLSSLAMAIAYIRTADSDNDYVPDNATIVDYQNDTGDVDTGVNGIMNHPILNTAVQNGDQLTFNYDLDTADSPSNEYRVEFFVSDPLQVGTEGGMAQTLLGTVTVSPGPGQSSTITLPSSSSLDGKVFSATATAVNAGLTYGFGSTSRVSPVITLSSEAEAETTPTDNNDSTKALAETGRSIQQTLILAAVLMLSGAPILRSTLAGRRKHRLNA